MRNLILSFACVSAVAAWGVDVADLAVPPVEKKGPQVATIRETLLSLPTYPFSDPDPVPRTDQKRYPYFRYDGSSATSVAKNWKAVILENEKIKVTMLPEIGGKVWGAEDKSTGHEFLYYNHAVKFRDISMRGPWCSGGIEFNFGIVGHAPTSPTPVEWCVKTNSDDSVSCYVSATEYINRTTWQIEVRLGAKDDYFETRTRWFNGSNLPQPYYQWMNAAYSARGNPKFYFPGSTYVGHPGDAHDWPFDAKGRDLSQYGNNAFGSHKSYHVVNGDNSFYAVWWPELGFGSIHENPPYDKYGRKIWLWALSRQGGIWEDLLTDTDGQYVELQSGRCFHQPGGETWRTPFKHPTFAPGVTDTYVERWGYTHDENTLKAKLDPNKYVHRPLEMPTNFNWQTAYGHYLRGEQAVRERDDVKGEAELRASLALDPHLVPALDVLAGLQARRGLYDEVRALAVRALAINTYDPEANYLDGLAALAQDDLGTAKERLGVAAFSPTYRTPAYVLLAKAEMRSKNWLKALHVVGRAMENSDNLDARLLQIAIFRKINCPMAALSAARELVAEYPLLAGVHYELKKLGEDSEDFPRSLRCELPNQTLLELGSWYEEAGLDEEALELFGWAWNDPIARIRTAYLLSRKGEAQKSALELLVAAKLPAANVFPFRRETRAALAWAVDVATSWKFRYWAAVQYAANGEGQKADELLEALENTPDEDVFYQYRASRRKGAARRADLQKALSIKKTWRAYRDLANLEDKEGTPEAMCRVAQEGLALDPARNALQMAYARALVKLGRFMDAVKFLEEVRILPSECADNAHAIWVDAWKGEEAAARARGDTAAADRAKAKGEEYPENLGAGKPFPKEKE